MEKDVSDILDLCRLNLMEEHIVDSPAIDRDQTLQAIDYARRQLVIKIKPATLAPDAMERHIKENTVDNIYPWTDGCVLIRCHNAMIRRRATNQAGEHRAKFRPGLIELLCGVLKCQ